MSGWLPDDAIDELNRRALESRDEIEPDPLGDFALGDLDVISVECRVHEHDACDGDRCKCWCHR